MRNSPSPCLTRTKEEPGHKQQAAVTGPETLELEGAGTETGNTAGGQESKPDSSEDGGLRGLGAGRQGRKGSQVGGMAAGPAAQHSGAQNALGWRQCPYLCHVKPVATAPSVARIYQQETLAGIGEEAQITATWKLLRRDAPTLSTGRHLLSQTWKKGRKAQRDRVRLSLQGGSQPLGAAGWGLGTDPRAQQVGTNRRKRTPTAWVP